MQAPPEALEWPHRLPLVLEEILASRADVACLQEVNHFDDLAAALAPVGYTGFFHPKPGSPCERYGFPPDGLAVFVRNSRCVGCGGWQQ